MVTCHTAFGSLLIWSFGAVIRSR